LFCVFLLIFFWLGISYVIKILFTWKEFFIKGFTVLSLIPLNYIRFPSSIIYLPTRLLFCLAFHLQTLPTLQAHIGLSWGSDHWPNILNLTAGSTLNLTAGPTVLNLSAGPSLILQHPLWAFQAFRAGSCAFSSINFVLNKHWFVLSVA